MTTTAPDVLDVFRLYAATTTEIGKTPLQERGLQGKGNTAMTASPATEEIPVDDIYRDPITEHWLDGWGVTYHLTMLDVARIDFNGSRRYQNRGGATTSNEQVFAIASMMADPAFAVPPIVVTWHRNGSALIIDGNHRSLAAVKAERTCLAAYVVTTDAVTLDRMALAANARNAQHVTNDMRDRLIVSAVAGGMSNSEVGRQWGISGTHVTHVMRAHAGRELLHGIGVNVSQVATKSAEVAAQLDREHLIAIGPKAATAASADELRGIVQEIKKAPPSQQIDVARDAGQRLLVRKAQAKTPGAKRKAVAAGMSATRTANALAKVTTAIQETPSLLNDAKVSAAVAALIKVTGR